MAGIDLNQKKAGVVTTPYVRPHECVHALKYALPSCQGTPFYKEHEGKRFCIFHYPGKEKSKEFGEAIKKRLETTSRNFNGFWFPDKVRFFFSHFKGEADFTNATFTEEADFTGKTFTHRVDFGSAIFNAKADFQYARFDGWGVFTSAEFNGEAFFMECTFKDSANFHGAKFTKDAFFHATFEAEAIFSGATFGERAEFSGATFSKRAEFGRAKFQGGANFKVASFNDHVIFEGRVGDSQVFGYDSWVDIQQAKLEKPDRVSFHSLTLRPNWFVNVDSRKFDFTNVNWNWSEITLDNEIKALEKKSVSSPYHLLSIAFRHLAFNAEENHRYEEASKFRYWSMDARRPEKWHAHGFWKTDWFHFLYWAASGYGERILRASLWLLAIWFVSTLVYWRAAFVENVQRDLRGDETPPAPYIEQVLSMDFNDACGYSVSVMTLQKPEPRPVNKTTKWVVRVESVLGPLQAALLALAVRRRFMR